MTAENPELQSLRERLERLEKQNRWFKRAAAAALLAAAAMIVMGQTRPTRTVTASKFVLLDSQDRTRAVLQTDLNGTGSALTFMDATGRKRLVLAGGTGPVGNTFAYVELGEDAATGQYVLASTGDHGGATLSDGGLVVRAFPSTGKAGSVMLQGPGPGGPALELTDSEGYTADLGVTGIVIPGTGEKRTTSAASLVLFGKDRKVIWQAPSE